MPPKKRKTVQEGNWEFLLGAKAAKPRTKDGKFASDPFKKLMGKKKK